MARWRIVCTKRATIADPVPHSHIVDVGIGERHDWADMRWRLDQVLAAMAEGDVFYTQTAGGDTAEIETYVCPTCGDVYVRSTQDKVQENDLENLRECIYEAVVSLVGEDGKENDLENLRECIY